MAAEYSVFQHVTALRSQIATLNEQSFRLTYYALRNIFTV